jgi:hypothetical protein
MLIGKLSLLRPLILLAPDVSAGRTARELWCTSQELSPARIITIMALHMMMAAVQRHSLTPPQSISRLVRIYCLYFRGTWK